MSRGVLVTGASGGIGRAVAQAFAALGDRVCVHYAADAEGAHETRESLAGSGHSVFRADLADPGQAGALAAEAESALGGVDVLVNNAGRAPTSANRHPVDTSDAADWLENWRATLDATLISAALLTHGVVRNMIEAQRPGRVVSIGSRGAYRGEPDHPAYGAAKAALHSMTQSLAVSLAPRGIAVTAVAPGVTETRRTSGLVHGENAQAVRAQSPFGRVASPNEVASAVVYLASADAQWASGAILDLNGASYFR